MSPKNPFRIYGINHFSRKYGIPLNPQGVGTSNVEVVENEIQDNIVTWIKTDYGDVPLFEEPKGENYIEKTGTGVRINFDVFNEVGHILSGHLEKLTPEEKEKISGIPIVDIYEQVLFESIFPGRTRNKPFWPEGKKFAVCLTHDVDEIRKTYQYLTKPFFHLKKGEFSRALSQVKSFFTDKLSGGNPYWTFERVMSIEEELGVKSTFFFLQEGGKVELSNPGTWKLYARKYRFDDLPVIKIIRKLSSDGWEVGLHGSYYSYLDQEKLRKEKESLESALGKPVQGIRQHNLNLKIPDTWGYQENIGLEYDTTLGSNQYLGFRYGTCFPFNPLNQETEKPLSITEIPMIMEDIVIFRAEDPWKECSRIIETVEKLGGVLTLLWHHSVFNENEYPGWTEMYRKIITTCQEKGAWITTANEINKYWGSRENV